MENNAFTETYRVDKGSFDTAGEASSKIKRLLKNVGVPPEIIRDVAIAAYETELNLVIHSLGGELSLTITPEQVLLVSRDDGPGIPDLSLALKEGFSTAPESVRMMGFGAGMGLPNVKRHCHDFSITSEVGKGTVIKALYHLK